MKHFFLPYTVILKTLWLISVWKLLELLKRLCDIFTTQIRSYQVIDLHSLEKIIVNSCNIACMIYFNLLLVASLIIYLNNFRVFLLNWTNLTITLQFNLWAMSILTLNVHFILNAKQVHYILLMYQLNHYVLKRKKKISH